MNEDKSVLLLNNSEEVVNLISWQRAVSLVCSGKASKPHGHDEFYEIRTTNGVYELPTAVVLAKYVRVPYSMASLSRKNIIKRDENKCQYCNRTLSGDIETLDHVMPTSRGGKNTWKNVVAACKPCNTKKADRTPEEAGMKLLRQPYVPSRDVLIVKVLRRKNMDSWSRWITV